MNMSNEEYGRLVKELSPKTKKVKNCFHAFWIGGTICLLGQLLLTLFRYLGFGEKESGAFVSICLILLSAVLTGLSLYDDIAKLAGAGTLVPITGFANSVVAPAVEFRTEGLILGTCGRMFTIAGPVLVFGTFAGWIYGFLYWIWKMI